MWLLLGYPSNIIGYPSKYWSYTSTTKLGWLPHSPLSPPVDNFFNIHFTKNIIEHKRCRIRFYNGLYTVIISVFMNNKREIYKFWIFEFLIFCFFKISDIGLLWSKITIFIIEITLNRLLHIKYGWNNPNWGRFPLKSPKLYFLAISGSSKFIAYTNIQVHVTCSIFIVIFFKMLVTMSSIRINHNWNYPKLLIKSQHFF